MKKKYLLALAKKIQIDIREKEMNGYISFFENFLRLIEEFKKEKITEGTKIMDRIDLGFLTLGDLEENCKELKEDILDVDKVKKNCVLTEDNFVCYKNKQKP